MAKLGNLTVAITASTVGLRKGFSTAGGIVGGFGRGIGRATGVLRGFAGEVANVAGIGGSLGAVGIAGWGVKLAADAEMAKVGFTTLLGSEEEAVKMLGDLRQFAATTPFQFPELADTTKRMLAMGFAASEVPATLRTIGDTASALGGGTEVMQGMVLALGQMRAKGKVSAEEMNQLAERGVPAWKFLADSIGVGIPEAMKMAEQGTITASQAIPGILEGMNQQFEGGMARAAETISGRWSTLKDNIGLAAMQMGQAIIDGFDLKTRITEATEFVKFLPAAFNAIAASGRVIWENIGGVIEGTFQNILAAGQASFSAILVGFQEIWNQGEKIFEDLGALVTAFSKATYQALTDAFDLKNPIDTFRKTFDREFSKRSTGAFKDVGKAMSEEFKRVFDAKKSTVPGDVIAQAKQAFQDSLASEDFSNLIEGPKVATAIKDEAKKSTSGGGGFLLPGIGLAVTGALASVAQATGTRLGPIAKGADLVQRGSSEAISAFHRFLRGDVEDDNKTTAKNTGKSADLLEQIKTLLDGNQTQVAVI